MYYISPPQAYVQPAQQNFAEVQNWQEERKRDGAMRQAGQHFWGWRAIDARQAGNQYRVHMCDSAGHYHTVLLDDSGNVLQDQDGYR